MADAMREILTMEAEGWELDEIGEQDLAEALAWLAGERPEDRWADDGGRQ